VILAVAQPLPLAGLERASRRDQPPVDRQEVGLGYWAFVRDRDPQEHLALPLAVPNRAPPDRGLLVPDRDRQLGAPVEQVGDAPVELVDLGAQAGELGALARRPGGSRAACSSIFASV
jgi:hypothetical protein